MRALRHESIALLGAAMAAVACGSAATDDGSGGSGGETTTSTGGGGSGVNPRCEPLCSELLGANCSGGPTLNGCLLTCKTLTSSATCEPSADAYFDCVDAADVQCSAEGTPYALGCGDEYLVAIDCAVSADPNPSMEQPCGNYCDAVVAADCPNSGTQDECYSNCLWLGASGTGCDDAWGSFLDCADAATFVCLLGYASAQGCGPAYQAYVGCLDAAGSG